MEILAILEKKIALLVESVQTLKKENLLLVEQNKELQDKYDLLKGSSDEESKGMQKLQEEKELTKMMLDNLINDIDSLVKNENRQS